MSIVSKLSLFASLVGLVAIPMTGCGGGGSAGTETANAESPSATTATADAAPIQAENPTADANDGPPAPDTSPIPAQRRLLKLGNPEGFASKSLESNLEPGSEMAYEVAVVDAAAMKIPSVSEAVRRGLVAGKAIVLDATANGDTAAVHQAVYELVGAKFDDPTIGAYVIQKSSKNGGGYLLTPVDKPSHAKENKMKAARAPAGTVLTDNSIENLFSSNSKVTQ